MKKIIISASILAVCVILGVVLLSPRNDRPYIIERSPSSTVNVVADSETYVYEEAVKDQMQPVGWKYTLTFTPAFSEERMYGVVMRIDGYQTATEYKGTAYRGNDRINVIGLSAQTIFDEEPRLYPNNDTVVLLMLKPVRGGLAPTWLAVRPASEVNKVKPEDLIHSNIFVKQ